MVSASGFVQIYGLCQQEGLKFGGSRGRDCDFISVVQLGPKSSSYWAFLASGGWHVCTCKTESKFEYMSMKSN